MIKNKEHLTEKGLFKIVELKSSLNLGLPDKLKKACFASKYYTRARMGA
jgi:hypothetical protein